MACINVIDLSTTTWLIINALKAQMLDTYLYLVNQMSENEEREMERAFLWTIDYDYLNR